MPGTMGLYDLVDDLKRSLHDCATVFDAAGDADFVRFLNHALADMGWKRPITRLAQVLLQEGVASYTLAAYPDFQSYKTHLWDMPTPRMPWDANYPGALPRVTAQHDGAQSVLAFDPAPSAAHIGLRGSVFRFYYFARHAIGVDVVDTTVAPQDRGLLMLRAQVEAMIELTLRNAAKPVQLRDGLSGTPRNSTPRALADALLQQFMEAR